MDTHEPHPIDQREAQQQLATIEGRTLASARDRRVHAVGTVVYGVTIGLLMGARNMVSESQYLLLSLVAVVVLLAEFLLVERAARTVPRRARRWSRIGFAASFIIALVLVTPWLNLSAQTAPNTWPMVLVAALVTAAPSVVAGAVIARGGR
ncbi:hypothetical protein ICW40_18495 [Actinotalea ferrariae]|uniref:hypothetical protein n=1 Tax=Actinotalea ferrariae TaxID=1386098 RepID=UPI001C8B9DE4|nr:hypothetical protein [Actinotalea ferrariae]MBX9246783.1 hypothetical protein [Actinotalea ferrariae]